MANNENPDRQTMGRKARAVSAPKDVVSTDAREFPRLNNKPRAFPRKGASIMEASASMLNSAPVSEGNANKLNFPRGCIFDSWLRSLGNSSNDLQRKVFSLFGAHAPARRLFFDQLFGFFQLLLI